MHKVLYFQYNAALICNIHTPPHVSGEVVFSERLSVCPSVHPSDMNPVSEVEITSNISVVLILHFLCNLKGHLARVALLEGKHTMLRIQLLFNIISLLVGIKLLCSSICRFPPNRANGEAVFEGSPIRYNNAAYPWIFNSQFPGLWGT